MSRLQKKKLPARKINKKELSSESSQESGSQVSSVKLKSSSSGAIRNNRKQEKSGRVNPGTGTGELNYFQKGLQFFREVRIELRKVTWPTKKQTINSTVVIIIFVFIIAAFLGLVDFGLSKLVQVVLA